MSESPEFQMQLPMVAVSLYCNVIILSSLNFLSLFFCAHLLQVHLYKKKLFNLGIAIICEIVDQKIPPFAKRRLLF